MVLTPFSLSKLINNLREDPNSSVDYSWTDNILRYKDRVAISLTSTLKTHILAELHSSPTAEHAGIQKTYARTCRSFFWTSMKNDILTFVVECDVCQRNKGEIIKLPGTLQPLPLPTSVWIDFCMDSITSLPKSGNKLVIMVVVDRLSKYAHFCTLPHPFTPTLVAQAFMDQIFKLHGMPTSIVSDRDSTFTRKFWQELFKLEGTQLQLSTTYHPQTDAQTEAAKKCLETYLRCFTFKKQHQWVQWIPLDELWYYNNYHEATKMTPYEVVYRQLPPSPISYIPGCSKVKAFDQILHNCVTMITPLKYNLD